MRGFLARIRRTLLPDTGPWRTRERVTAEQLINAFSTDWCDRTREQKRLTAPYALGWEEGYAAAYRQFLAMGRVTLPPGVSQASYDIEKLMKSK